jgi:Holliday junction resolvase-like predicted endonuclease
MKEDNIKPKQGTEAEETQPLNTEGQIIIEEKQSKPNGEINII